MHLPNAFLFVISPQVCNSEELAREIIGGRIYFRHSVFAAFVNGVPVWQNGEVNDSVRGMPLEFNRPQS